MSATFMKALILTLLIFIQAKSTDAALLFVQNTGLPKELFLLIGMGVFILGFFIYRLSTRRISLNN